MPHNRDIRNRAAVLTLTHANAHILYRDIYSKTIYHVCLCGCYWYKLKRKNLNGFGPRMVVSLPPPHTSVTCIISVLSYTTSL